MKKILLASVAASAIGAANCAYAADLGAPPPPPPVFSWTGCHIGPHVGLATGRNTWQDTQPASISSAYYKSCEDHSA